MNLACYTIYDFKVISERIKLIKTFYSCLFKEVFLKRNSLEGFLNKINKLIELELMSVYSNCLITPVWGSNELN